MIKLYYQLTKPGIIYGNALSATAGFLFASCIIRKFDPGLYIAFIAGTSLVIACGCVINNYIDRGLDKNMARTSNRALVLGKIPTRSALLFGVLLGIIGFWLLFTFTNNITAMLGVIGLFFYLIVYSIMKRQTALGTVVGSVSGATPMAAGYTAVIGDFNGAAIFLFLSMVFWQMPHFYSIAIYRFQDYKSAGLPVLPVTKGFRHTKHQIIGYIAAFTVTASLLTVFDYTGYVYMAIIFSAGLYWLFAGLDGLKASDDKVWGRQMFKISLIVLLIYCIALSVGELLP